MPTVTWVLTANCARVSLGTHPQTDSKHTAPHLRLFLLMKQTVDAFKVMAARGDGSSLAEVDRAAASWLAEVGPNLSPFDAIANPQGEDKDRVIRFFKLPWFSRTWILQEVGLASDESWYGASRQSCSIQWDS